MSSVALVRSPLVALAVLLMAAPSQADTLKVPGEFETIQAAVDAAGLGDTVLVSKGTYNENVVVGTAGIVLKGKKAVINGGYAGNCILVSANDVEVTGFTLVNGGGLILLEGPGDGDPVGGLRVLGTGAVISKLEVAACDDFGIRLEGTGTIEKCKVDSCLGAGIVVQTADVLGSVVTEVSKNTVTRCVVGIDLNEGPFLVEKNEVEDSLDDGLQVNIPLLASEGGPAVQPTTISKNTCRDNGGTGLSMFKGTGPTTVVDKNALENNGLGLLANGFTYEITANTIQDNRFGGATLDTNESTFSGNKVKGNGLFGVVVFAPLIFADGGSVDGSNLLTDNTVQDNGGDGIHVASDFNVLESNVVKDNLGDGVQLEGSGVILNQVHDHKVTGNGHDGIDNSAASTLLVGNVCKDNGGADLAGVGGGGGTVDEGSADNVTGDGTDLTSTQELELDTLD